MGVALKRILEMCLRSLAFFCFFLVVPHDMHMICIVDVAYERGLSFMNTIYYYCCRIISILEVLLSGLAPGKSLQREDYSTSVRAC